MPVRQKCRELVCGRRVLIHGRFPGFYAGEVAKPPTGSPFIHKIKVAIDGGGDANNLRMIVCSREEFGAA